MVTVFINGLMEVFTKEIGIKTKYLNTESIIGMMVGHIKAIG